MRISAVVWSAEDDDRAAIFREIAHHRFTIFHQPLLKGYLDAVSLVDRIFYPFGIKLESLAEEGGHLLNQGSLKVPEMEGGSEELPFFHFSPQGCPDHEGKRLYPGTVGIGGGVSLAIFAADNEGQENIVDTPLNQVHYMAVHQLHGKTGLRRDGLQGTCHQALVRLA